MSYSSDNMKNRIIQVNYVIKALSAMMLVPVHSPIIFQIGYGVLFGFRLKVKNREISVCVGGGAGGGSTRGCNVGSS
jgi:hypothetical protein